MSTTSLAAVLGVSGAVMAAPVAETAISGTNADDMITEPSVELTLTGDEKVTATGVNGRGGNDTVGVELITISATTADTVLDAFSVDLASPALKVQAFANGVQGGSGDDMLFSDGGGVFSTATGGIIDFAIIQENPEALSTLNIESLLQSRSIGLNGAAGLDHLELNGPLRVEAFSEGRRDNVNLIGLDIVDFSSKMTVDATATGLLGGNDANTFLSTGEITAVSTARSLLSNTDIGLLSASTGLGDITSKARSTGIQGGGARDVIFSTGGMDIRSTAFLEQTNSAVSLAEAVTFMGQGVGNATSFGVLSGNGDDHIVIGAGLNMISSLVDLNSTSFTLAVSGANQSDISFSGKASATGVSAGGDDDSVELGETALLDVSATAYRNIDETTLTVIDVSPVLPSGPAGEKNKIRAIASGISLDGGNDSVDAIGNINVSALSDINSLGVAMTVEAAPKLSGYEAYADSDMVAIAAADGLTGGGGIDTMSASGELFSSSTAKSQIDVVSVSFPVGVPVPGFGAAGAATVFLSAGSEARSTAQGFDGGNDDDVLTYSGLNMDVSSFAEAQSTLVFLDAEVDVFPSPVNLPALEFSLLKSTAVASAKADGFFGGAGNDDIFLEAGAVAKVLANAKAENTAVTVEMGLDLDPTEGGPLSFGVNLSGFDTRATSVSNAWGFNGGAGDDTISNFGSMTVDAVSMAKSGSYHGGARPQSDGIQFDAIKMFNLVDSRATARGMAGGGGGDTLLNVGSLTTTADAHGVLEDVSAALNYSGPADPSVSTGVVIYDTRGKARATAIGIDALVGALGAENRGVLTTESIALAENLGIQTSIDFVTAGGSINAAAMQTDIYGYASVFGVKSQSAAPLLNSGALTAMADSTATSTSVDATIAISKEAGLAGGASLQTSKVDAVAVGYGMWGVNDLGIVQNTGSVKTTALAKADALAVDVDVQATTIGLAFDGAVIDAATKAMATGTGLGGKGAGFSVENAGTLTVEATADADATSVASGLSVVPSAGLVLSGALADASTTAKTTAFGMRTIGDNGEQINGGDLSVMSTAHSNADAVNVSAGFVGTGLIIDVAAVDANSKADARAYGMHSAHAQNTDLGNDTLRNMAALTAVADALADSDSISTSVNVAPTGVSIDAGVVEADSNAKAYATGMYSGRGNDLIEFAQPPAESLAGAPASTEDPSGGPAPDDLPVPVMADITAAANVNTTAVGIDFDFVGAGAAVSNAIATARSSADADAIGYDAGSGADNIIVKSDTTIRADAKISGAAVNVALAGAGVGASGGVSWVDLQQGADARAEGLRGGAGGDYLENQATVITNALSDVRGVGVSVGGGVTLSGASLGVSVTDLTTMSKSNAVGMAGHTFSTGGADTDFLLNTGALETNAVSIAKSDAISIRGDVAFVPISFSLAEAGSTAVAFAKGMAGSGGDDIITNQGQVVTYGRSTASGFNLSVALAGAGLGDVSSTSISTARGIDAGAGSDEIHVEGALETRSKATTGSQSIAATGIGLAGSKTKTSAEANAVGVFAGAGGDMLRVSDLVFTEAVAQVHSSLDEDDLADAVNGGALNLNVSLGGAAYAEMGADFTAAATGIDAGADNDIIELLDVAAIDVNAVANYQADIISITLAGGSAYLADFTSKADAVGVALGHGVNQLSSAATMDAYAKANLDSFSFALNGAGSELSSSLIVADASAAIVEGASGVDNINIIGGILNAGADALSDGMSINIQGGGFAVDGADLSATALAKGVTTAGGADIIYIGAQSLDAKSDAIVKDAGVSVQLVGVTAGSLGMTADAGSIGIDAGGGDDSVVSDTILISDAEAHASTGSVSFQGIGFDSDMASLLADANAVGILAGGGGDVVTNNNSIHSRAYATISNNGVNIRLLGGGTGRSNSTALATAYGVDGDAGNDFLYNHGEIQALAQTRTTTSNTSVSIVDVGVLDSTRFSWSNATGVSGGGGSDYIENTGSIKAIADATLSNKAVSVNIGGGGVSMSSLNTRATAIGVDAGSGNDSVLIAEGSSVDAISCAAAVYDSTTGACRAGGSNTVDINVVGAKASDSDLVHSAVSYGVMLGGGADELVSYADIFASATTDVRSSSLSVTGLGYSGEASDSSANATAKGVLGGNGRDNINLAGEVYARAFSNLEPSSMNLTLAGYATSDFVFGAEANASGADGGAGNDMIVFDGSLLKAYSDVSISSNSFTNSWVGASNVGSILTGESIAGGLFGDDGSDTLVLRTVSDVDAHADVHLDGGSFTYIGGTVIDGGVTADSLAFGATGGAGGDLISFEPGSEQNVLARAGVVAENGALIGYGSASSNSGSGAVATAYGVQGDDGNDVIRTAGLLIVNADTGSTARSSSYVQYGGSRANLNAGADSIAIGVDGGADVNDIANSGDIFVIAKSRAVGRGASIQGGSASTTAKSGADTKSSSTAIGISGGDERDVIVNMGLVDVEARAGSFISNSSSNGGVWVKSQTNSHVYSYMSAIGIDAGASDDDMVINEGTIQVDLTSGSANERTRAESYSGNGSPISINSDAGAYAVASMNNLRAFGVKMSSGKGEVYNSGDINVAVETKATSYADTNPNGLSGADGSATSKVGVSGGYISGIEATGTGDKIVTNDGTIYARLHPGSGSSATADADGINIGSEPDSKTYVRIDLNNNYVHGVHVGSGEDRVINNGSITVENLVYANRARAVSGPGQGIESIDAEAEAIASASGVYGYGIRDDGGNNTVVNNGDIDVLVSPLVEASTSATGRAYDGDATALSTASVKNAIGYGVLTGGGADTIINNGAISVRLAPLLDANASASPGKHPLNNGEAVVRTTESATGIYSYGINSGSGDDYVLNNGSITATRTRGSGNILGIETSNGNDTVELSATSSTSPHIKLGAGDDRLIYHAGAVIGGGVIGESGVDTLEVVGAGTFSISDIRNWENLEKSGAGHFRVTSPVSWQDVVINEGTLTATVRPLSTASLTSFFDGSGRIGTFETAAGYTLGGAFTLNAGPNPFSDGQRGRIINANGLTYAPMTESLPAATPLLSFSMDVGANAADVVASVEAFTSAAATADQAALAQSFDDTLAAADASFYDTNLAYTMGSIQKLGAAAEIQAAYDALMPTIAAPDMPAAAAVTTGAADAVEDTLGFARMSLMASDAETSRLGFTGVDFADYAGGKAWSANLSGDLGVNPTNAESFQETEYTSFINGVNIAVSDNSLLGFSYGVNSVSTERRNGYQEADEDKFASLYGMHVFGDGVFVEAVGGYAIVDARRYDRGLPAAQVDLAEGKARNLTGDVRLGKILASEGDKFVELYARAGYNGFDFDHADRTNTLGLGQMVSSVDQSAVEAGLGMRFDGAFKSDRFGAVTASLNIEYTHDVDYNAGGSRVVFDDAPEQSFVIGRNLRSSNALQARWGAKWAVSDRVDLSFVGKGQYRENGPVGALRLEMTSRF